MGRHRFDENSAGKWGGPDLVSTQDGRQSTTHSATTHSATSRHATPPRPGAHDDQGGADTEPISSGTA